tara:strand:- start:248 stop:433 length:186 start_codon:yes stop_codon:yes gene_type:complete
MIMEENNWYVLHTKVNSMKDKSVRYYGPFEEKHEAVYKMDTLWRDEETHSVIIKFGGSSLD